jgi:hypothetical protein
MKDEPYRDEERITSTIIPISKINYTKVEVDKDDQSLEIGYNNDSNIKFDDFESIIMSIIDDGKTLVSTNNFNQFEEALINVMCMGEDLCYEEEEEEEEAEGADGECSK